MLSVQENRQGNKHRTVRRQHGRILKHLGKVRSECVPEKKYLACNKNEVYIKLNFLFCLYTS